MAKTERADVVIVGAGVIGCAIGRALARRGAAVIIVEKDRPGRAASWAAAGMLSPFSESLDDDPMLDLCDASLNLYPDFARELLEETAIDVQYRTNGKLHVSFGPGDDVLRGLAASANAQRFGMTLLDGDAARALEPGLPRSVTSALRVERDHTVNNRLLAQALNASATAAGVVFRHPRTVQTLLMESGQVTGIRTDRGDLIGGSSVVLAAGASTTSIEGLPRPVPLRPVRGQMFAVATHNSEYAHLTHTVQSDECYVVPRPDGRLLVGATVENTGLLDGPTPSGMIAMMNAGTKLLPYIADLPITDTWSSFRPAAPDDLPILGADPDVHGLFYATAHYRNGILLTPITAQYIAALIAGEPVQLPMNAFRPDRFAGR